MSQSKCITGLGILILTVTAYWGANSVAVAKAILQPGATRGQIIRAVMNPPY